MEDGQQDPFTSIPSDRRAFIKKMVAVAFVAPVIGTFGLDELASASERDRGKQWSPNSSYGNQNHHHHDHHHDHDHDHDHGKW
jgi:ABC-type Zn2+ transport system substrate-binding protein/surface adhesin